MSKPTSVQILDLLAQRKDLSIEQVQRLLIVQKAKPARSPTFKWIVRSVLTSAALAVLSLVGMLAHGKAIQPGDALGGTFMFWLLLSLGGFGINAVAINWGDE